MTARTLTILLLLGAAATSVAGQAPVLVTVDRLVVGEFRGGRWHDASGVKESASGGRFTRIGVGRTLGGGRWRRLTVSPGNGAVEIDAPATGVAVTGIRPKTRPVLADRGAFPRCRASLEALLRSRGARGGVVQKSAYRTDLDGDGRSESILSVASRPGLKLDDTPRRGDFSALVLLPSGSTRIRPEQIAHLGVFRGEDGTDLWFHEIRAVADVNGDGKQEVVISTGYQLGPGAKLLGYRNGRPVKLAEAMNDEP